jgi:hypothetical protein
MDEENVCKVEKNKINIADILYDRIYIYIFWIP